MFDLDSLPVDLHVQDTGGNGRPVVLIHGWPLSSSAWEHQISAFRDAGFRVITYDRRGFGRSEKPDRGYDYDTLAGDTHALIEALDLADVTLVGFSMGGGEVARYVGNHGEERLRSVVFASAVPPCMMQSDDNPDGPLSPSDAREMRDNLKASRSDFFEQFAANFYTANDELKVSEAERQKAIAQCHQSDQMAALGCMEAFGNADFREDLPKITVPALVIHGDADVIVPIDGSARRTANMVRNANLHVLQDAPHGCNVSHATPFNNALLDFLKKH